MGACTNDQAVLTDSVPTTMVAPSVDAADINPYWIKLTWSGITSDTDIGRDNIVYYGIEWDQGTNTWMNLTTDSVGITYSFNHTFENLIQNNTVFRYRTFAKNGVGYGNYSDVSLVTTDNTPTRMNAPDFTQVNYNAISLTWEPISSAADTGGEPVTYYYVDFYERPCFAADNLDCSTENVDLGTWKEISVESTQKTSTTFTHTSATHFHPAVDFKYRICAKNTLGLGACSSELTVTTNNVPSKMTAPLNVTVLSNEIQIKFSVVQNGSSSGNSPVTKYTI